MTCLKDQTFLLFGTFTNQLGQLGDAGSRKWINGIQKLNDSFHIALIKGNETDQIKNEIVTIFEQ
jgi:hypothetical protein